MNKSVLIGALLACVPMNAPGQAPPLGTGNTNTGGPGSPPISGCLSNNFPAAKGSIPGCCRQGYDFYHVIPLPAISAGLDKDYVLAHRQIGNACTLNTGTGNCFVLPSSVQGQPGVCDFGPCGATIVERWMGSHAVVFPAADPQNSTNKVWVSGNEKKRRTRRRVPPSIYYRRTSIPAGGPGNLLL